MHPDLESLFYKAEAHYLEPVEIKLLRHHVGSLALRLQTYEQLRDQEMAIFQAIADQLVKEFPLENSQLLEKVLKQWITILRYAAMAMLLNNPEFLQRRVLEWLTEVTQAQQSQTIAVKLCSLLQSRLREVLPESSQVDLILPLLDQAQTTLFGVPALQSLKP